MGILQAKNTRVGSHPLLQGISPTQGVNQGLLHCRQILYQLSYQGSPSESTAPLHKNVIHASGLIVTAHLFQNQPQSICLEFPDGL